MFLFCLQGIIIFLSLTFKVVYPLTPIYFPQLSATIFLHKPFLSAEWEYLSLPYRTFNFASISEIPFFPLHLPAASPSLRFGGSPFLTIIAQVRSQSILCTFTSQLRPLVSSSHPLAIHILWRYIQFNYAQNVSSLKAAAFVYFMEFLLSDIQRLTYVLLVYLSYIYSPTGI